MNDVTQTECSAPATAPVECVVLPGDCIEAMRSLPDASVDLVFADPPYNLQLRGTLHRPDESKVVGVDQDWDRFEDFATYDRFTRDWLQEARRVLRKDGSIWVIGSYHNIFRVGAILQDLGFWICNDVVWRKTNPMPNFRGMRLANAHETLIWATRSESARPTFNYESAKAGNEDIQLRSDWEFPICAGGERMKNVDGTSVHPTQKPEALLTRILSLTTNEGDLVLDPFSGTGTTCAVAKSLRRRWIGIERDETYRQASIERIASVEPLPLAAVNVPVSRKKAVRIPFSDVVSAGYVKPGSRLVSRCLKHSVVVRVDGSVSCAGVALSIHKSAARLLGLQAVNGWGYWYVRSGRDLVSIDTFRESIRASKTASTIVHLPADKVEADMDLEVFEAA